MAKLNSRQSAAPKAAQSVSKLIVKRSKRKVKAAPMLTEDIAPAGKYRSEIVGVADAKSDVGKLMVDVTYRLTDDRGKSVDARIRYPAEGYHIQKFFDALIDAGLPEESPLTEAVGIEEEVEIVYPFEGALGKIKSRKPAPVAKPPAKNPKRVVSAEDDQDDDSDLQADEDTFDEEDEDFLDEDD